MNYLFTHEVNGIFLKHRLIILTQLFISLFGSFKSLLTSIFEKEILDFLTFSNPFIKLFKFNFFTSIYINLLEHILAELLDVLSMGARESHKFAETLDCILY
jgi:hypothetical protein